ncbi:MAG: protein kinase [Phycisphaerae bacterium]|nr:protein kinase [Phycisphaerae bacterium]
MGENSFQPKDRVAALVGEYIDRRRSGEKLTLESFAAEHPELADDLEPYLAGLALMDQVWATEGGTVVGNESAPPATPLPAVRGYELIEEIGRGGMGVAYKALQVSTKRWVALKVMLGGPFASPTSRRRFKREVELAARLQHPAIVRVLESGVVSGLQYYAMDYIDGVPLHRYVADAKPTIREILGLFEQICEAIDYAHKHGVIHRDLKPGNVLIDTEGKPHILDFGLAKAMDRVESQETQMTQLSMPGQIMGTLPYLAPEQASGVPEAIGIPVDVYALGVMLFEVFTGTLPFDPAGSPSDVVRRILEQPPPAPSSLSDRVGHELETIILKAMEKDQSHRYHSAREMGEDLRRYLEGDPILANRLSGLYVLRKKVRKHWLRVGLAGCLLLMTLVVVWGGIHSRRRELANARYGALTTQRLLEEAWPLDAFARANWLFRHHPALPEVRLVRAQAYFRQDEYNRALRVLEDAKPDQWKWAYNALQADIYRDGGQEQLADRFQAEADRDMPDTAEAWYIRSFATIRRESARDHTEKAVTRDPHHALAWERLSHLRLHVGDLDGALQAADQVVELGGNATSWALFKGHIFAKQRRFEPAIDQYSKVIATLDGQASLYSLRKSYWSRAGAYRQMKEYAKALDDYDSIIRIDCGDPGELEWDYYQRATVCWILGRPEEAIKDYRMFAVRHGFPFYSDARLVLILRDLGRIAEAQVELQKARADVTDPWLAKVFACLDGELDPRELVEAADAQDLKQFCEAHYYAGEVALFAGDREQARSWFRKCVDISIEFDPDLLFFTPMNEYELARWRLSE